MKKSNPDASILPTREVMYRAVKMWRYNFSKLREMDVIPAEETEPEKFSAHNLTRLYESVNAPEDGRVIVFRYYLKNNKIKLALANAEDPQLCLTSDGGLVPCKELENEFQAWDTTFGKKEGLINEMLLYVKEYRYNWHWILTDISIEQNPNGGVQIENVAHMVGPNDINYQLPGMANKKEGYYALDIVIQTVGLLKNQDDVTESSNPEQFDLNFAMPCPRNCPK
jgi:hypothetical protein